MVRRGRRILAAALSAGLAVCLACAPSALADSRTATNGQVAATVTWAGTGPNVKNVRLRIVRAGQSVYDQPVTAAVCGKACLPVDLHVLPLQTGGEPQVILALWTQGANCCEIDQVFTWAPAAATYAEASRNFAYEGAALRDLDHNGLYEFVSADPSFKYQFTDGAASGLPIQIFSFSAGRFHDITRRYPKLIARDARMWLRAFRQAIRYHDTVGLIAAWAADEDLLGRSRQANAYLHQQLRRGHLTVPRGSYTPGGRRFLVHLQRFLRRHGYLR